MRADKHTKPSGSAAKRVLKGVGKVLGTMVLVLFLTTLIFACLFTLYVKNDLSAQVDSIDGFTLDQTSVIYYEDPKTGQDVVLRKLYGGANRTWVEYENIPKNLIHACIAIEDKRFEDHQGVDWFTTMKACVKMFLGQGEAGGSTITQQLVKNITGRDEVTVDSFIFLPYGCMVDEFQHIMYQQPDLTPDERNAVWLELEKKYTKKQIMELYLNVIALGENCEGVESASQVYFGKSVSELNARFENLAERLGARGVGHHYADETLLAKYGSVKGRRLVIGKCSYSTVVVPDMKGLDHETVELLKKFVDEGGRLYFDGEQVPSLVDGVPAKIGLVSNITFDDLKNPGVSIDRYDTAVRMTIRRSEFGDFIYAVNLSATEDFSLKLHVNARGAKRPGPAR